MAGCADRVSFHKVVTAPENSAGTTDKPNAYTHKRLSITASKNESIRLVKGAVSDTWNSTPASNTHSNTNNTSCKRKGITSFFVLIRGLLEAAKNESMSYTELKRRIQACLPTVQSSDLDCYPQSTLAKFKWAILTPSWPDLLPSAITFLSSSRVTADGRKHCPFVVVGHDFESTDRSSDNGRDQRPYCRRYLQPLGDSDDVSDLLSHEQSNCRPMFVQWRSDICTEPNSYLDSLTGMWLKKVHKIDPSLDGAIKKRIQKKVILKSVSVKPPNVALPPSAKMRDSLPQKRFKLAISGPGPAGRSGVSMDDPLAVGVTTVDVETLGPCGTITSDSGSRDIDFVSRSITSQDIVAFQNQERVRFGRPRRPFAYRIRRLPAPTHENDANVAADGNKSSAQSLQQYVVGPALKVVTHRRFTKDLDVHRFPELVVIRPKCVSHTSLLIDAIGRLPQGQGYVGHIFRLMAQSRYLVQPVNKEDLWFCITTLLHRLRSVSTAGSGDERLRYIAPEDDDMFAIFFDPTTQLWTFANHNRTLQDWENLRTLSLAKAAAEKANSSSADAPTHQADKASAVFASGTSGMVVHMDDVVDCVLPTDAMLANLCGQGGADNTVQLVAEDLTLSSLLPSCIIVNDSTPTQSLAAEAESVLVPAAIATNLWPVSAGQSYSGVSSRPATTSSQAAYFLTSTPAGSSLTVVSSAP